MAATCPTTRTAYPFEPTFAHGACPTTGYPMGFPTSSFGPFDAAFGGPSKTYASIFNKECPTSFANEWSVPSINGPASFNNGLSHWMNTPYGAEFNPVAARHGLLSNLSEVNALSQVAFRPANSIELYCLTNPIRVLDREGNRCIFLSFDLRGYKPEEITVTLNKTEKCIVVEAAHDIKEGKEHQVTRKFSRKFVLPESLAKVDFSKCELKSHLTVDGMLTVECPLPKMTAEEIAKCPIMSRQINATPFEASTWMNRNIPSTWFNTPYGAEFNSVAARHNWINTPYGAEFNPVAARHNWFNTPYGAEFNPVAARHNWFNTPFNTYGYPTTMTGLPSNWWENTVNTLCQVAFRPANSIEFYCLTNPIRVLDREGNRCIFLSFDLRGFKSEEITVTLNKAERCIVVEAAHDIKEGKEHHVTRKFSRKFVLPESLAKVDFSKCELKSHLTVDGMLTVECPLPKMTAEEIAKCPIMSRQINATHFGYPVFGGCPSTCYTKPIATKVC